MADACLAGLDAVAGVAVVAADLRAGAALGVDRRARGRAAAAVGRVADAVAVGVGAHRVGLAGVDDAVQVRVLDRVAQPVAVGVDQSGDLRVADRHLVRVPALGVGAGVGTHRDEIVGARVEARDQRAVAAVAVHGRHPRVAPGAVAPVRGPHPDAVAGDRRVTTRLPANARAVHGAPRSARQGEYHTTEKPQRPRVDRHEAGP